MVVACPPLGGPGVRKVRLQAAEWFAEGVDAAGGGAAAAGLIEFGVCVAAALAGGRRRPPWPPQALAGRCAGWAGRSWSGCGPRWRPARRLWGWGEDQRWTLARVTTLIGRLFHVRYTLRGHVVPAAPHRVHPAGPGAPGRGARRGEDRGVAGRDLGEGTRLAAATGAYVCFEDEAGQNLRPPEGPDLGPPRAHPRGQRSAARARGGYRWRGWCACGPAPGATCSTGSASTAGARASAARCPKPTTPA